MLNFSSSECRLGDEVSDPLVATIVAFCSTSAALTDTGTALRRNEEKGAKEMTGGFVIISLVYIHSQQVLSNQ